MGETKTATLSTHPVSNEPLERPVCVYTPKHNTWVHNESVQWASYPCNVHIEGSLLAVEPLEDVAMRNSQMSAE